MTPRELVLSHRHTHSALRNTDDKQLTVSTWNE
jgi:hypothetical protein